MFGERLLVLWYDDLVRDVRGFVRQILEFLELDPEYAASFDTTRHNETALPRNRVLTRLYASPRVLKAASSVVPDRLRASVESLMLTRRSVPELDPASRSVLQSVFDEDRVELERLLGRAAPWA